MTGLIKKRVCRVNFPEIINWLGKGLNNFGNAVSSGDGWLFFHLYLFLRLQNWDCDPSHQILACISEPKKVTWENILFQIKIKTSFENWWYEMVLEKIQRVATLVLPIIIFNHQWNFYFILQFIEHLGKISIARKIKIKVGLRTYSANILLIGCK